MRKKKSIAWAVVAVCGFGIGYLAGTKVAGLLEQLSGLASRPVIASHVERFALTQYFHADAEHARDALKSSAILLESLRAEGATQFYVGQKVANVYGRLAMLERQAGNAQAAQEYLEQSKKWFRAGGIQRPFSDDEVLEMIRRSDEADRKYYAPSTVQDRLPEKGSALKG